MSNTGEASTSTSGVSTTIPIASAMDSPTSTTATLPISTGGSGDGSCEQPVLGPDAGDLSVIIYEICDDAVGTGDLILAGLQPLERRISAGDVPLRAALEALLAGPTQEEVAAGFGSWFSLAMAEALLEASINTNGMATIDLDRELISDLNNVSTTTGGDYFRGQLYGTVFAFDEINTVQFSLDGNASSFCALMELIPDCTPITRDQWDEIYSQTSE